MTPASLAAMSRASLDAQHAALKARDDFEAALIGAARRAAPCGMWDVNAAQLVAYTDGGAKFTATPADEGWSVDVMDSRGYVVATTGEHDDLRDALTEAAEMAAAKADAARQGARRAMLLGAASRMYRWLAGGP